MLLCLFPCFLLFSLIFPFFLLFSLFPSFFSFFFFSQGYNGNATAINTELHGPINILIDASGNLIIADSNNNMVRQINITTGEISIIAGVHYVNGGKNGGYSGDNIQATAALLNNPNGIAYDLQHNLIICDRDSNIVRKITMSTGVITTIAGEYVLLLLFVLICIFLLLVVVIFVGVVVCF